MVSVWCSPTAHTWSYSVLSKSYLPEFDYIAWGRRDPSPIDIKLWFQCKTSFLIHQSFCLWLCGYCFSSHITICRLPQSCCAQFQEGMHKTFRAVSRMPPLSSVFFHVDFPSVLFRHLPRNLSQFHHSQVVVFFDYLSQFHHVSETHIAVNVPWLWEMIVTESTQATDLWLLSHLRKV